MSTRIFRTITPRVESCGPLMVLTTGTYRVVQTGTRSYYSEHFEMNQWLGRTHVELLDSYPESLEYSMWEDFDSIVNPHLLHYNAKGRLCYKIRPALPRTA